jgi:hypothetical protein
MKTIPKLRKESGTEARILTMKMENNAQGRRREERYKVVEDVFAVTTTNHGILGNILDISNRGLSFHCIASSDTAGETFELDLFFGGRGYLSRQIACKKVSDRTEHSQIPFSSVVMRRVGVNFLGLTQKQSDQLLNFIDTLTVGFVRDRRCGLDRRSGLNRRVSNHTSQALFERRDKDDRRAHPQRSAAKEE